MQWQNYQWCLNFIPTKLLLKYLMDLFFFLFCFFIIPCFSMIKLDLVEFYTTWKAKSSTFQFSFSMSGWSRFVLSYPTHSIPFPSTEMGVVPILLITIGITVTLIFPNILSYLARIKNMSLFSLSLENPLNGKLSFSFLSYFSFC